MVRPLPAGPSDRLLGLDVGVVRDAGSDKGVDDPAKPRQLEWAAVSEGVIDFGRVAIYRWLSWPRVDPVTHR